MFWLVLTASASLSLGGEDPWKFLDDFQPLPGTVTQIGENYVAMLYENRGQQRVAAVVFKAVCFANNCELLDRAGYAAADAGGSNSRVYVEPGEEELIDLLGSLNKSYSRNWY
jgi:hypothetical protein